MAGKVTAESAGFVRPEVARMAAGDWLLISQLLAGSEEMRNAHIKRDENTESVDSFRVRKELAVLFEQFKDGRDTGAARPFTRPVVINAEDKLPPPMQEFLKNVDLLDSSVHMFALELYRDALTWGKTHILVDAPQIMASDAEEQQRLGIRPYWKMIPGPSLHDWEEEIAPNGGRRLAWFKWADDYDVRDAEGKLKRIECRYVLYLKYAEGKPDPTTPAGTWEKWTKEKDQETWSVEAGTHAHIGDPLVILNLDKESGSRYMATPVYRDLAWTNYEHFWLTMLINYNLYFTAFTFIAFYGFTAQTAGGLIRVGPHSAHASPNTAGKAEFVEPGGTAAATLEKAREANEKRAVIQGLKPYIQKPGGTATGEAIRAASHDCDAQTWVHMLEDALMKATRIVVERANRGAVKIELPEEFSYDIHDDFSEVLGSDAQLAELRAAATSTPPLISAKLYREMAKKHRLIHERVDEDEEAAQIAAEAEERAERDAAAFVASGFGPDQPPPNKPADEEEEAESEAA